MKKLLLLALMLMMIISTVGCAVSPVSAAATASDTGAYQKIKPEEVKKKMDNGDEITIVDVRTAEEYGSAHLSGAINIPVETISDIKPAELTDLNAVIIVYCRTGVRSAAAAKKLAALGYISIYDMGGIIDWPYDTAAATDTVPSP